MSPAGDSRRRWLATTVGVIVGGTAHLLTLLDYRTRLDRQANPLGYASNFFDAQARALMDGHLYVPRGTLGIEGFIENGQEYTYFGPFPAILRMPILMTTHEFDGRLTTLSMALAFVVFAVMTTRLMWLVRDLMSDHQPVGRFEAIVMGVLLTLCLGGTVLTYNASLPWVYHEVYAWAVALVVGGLYWMVRVLQDPSPRHVAWLWAFSLAAIMTRTTGGWALCLTTIGIGAWLLRGRIHPDGRRRGGLVIAAGVLALAAGVALNWAKFRHPYLFPLQDQVWTDVNARRREALRVNGGTITGPQFFQTSLYNYFRPDGIRFVSYFPWVTLPATPAEPVGGAFLDQSYRTGSVTDFMPVSLLLTVLTVPVLFRRGVDRARRLLRAPFVAGVLVTGGVMAYGYLAHRYTCEFVPALILGACVGTTALTQWFRRRGRVLRGLLVTALALGTAYSLAVNMLTGYSAAAVTDGGADLQRYLDAQVTHAWPGPRPLLTQSDSRPSGGVTDQLHIQGDCDALFLNTGDSYYPWQLVERRSVAFKIWLQPDFGSTMVRLATINTTDKSTIWLETDTDNQARLVLDVGVGDDPWYRGPWFEVPPPGQLRVGIRDEPGLGYALVTSTPGGWVGYLRTLEWSDDWVAHPSTIRPAVVKNAATLKDLGITIREARGIDLPLCRRIRDAYAGSS